MRGYSRRYTAALILAARAHRDQTRKGGDVPYIVHPVGVATVLLRYDFPEDVVIAGLLHDVIEDQDVSPDEIESAFGPAVAEMVLALSERKREGQIERPWEDRKRDALRQLGQGSSGAVAVKGADVIHNAHSLAADLNREGASVWQEYSRGPQQSLWYYGRVLELVRGRLGAHPLVAEVEAAIGELELAMAGA